MANFYFRSPGAGALDGTSWTNAYASLSSASAKAAGDVFFVADDHAETQSTALSITFPGTVTSPNQILCVDHLVAGPGFASTDLKTTATVSTTTAANITLIGSFFCYGISFQPASTGGAVAANFLSGTVSGNQQRFQNCNIRCMGTSTSLVQLTGASTGGYTVLDNCSVRIGAVATSIRGGGRVVWQNSVAIDTGGGGLLPTQLFTGTTNFILICVGVDFSNLTAKIIQSTGACANILFKDCKLPTSGTYNVSAGNGIGTAEFYIDNCDSGGINYRNEKYTSAGQFTTDNTVFRASGASDGTTPISHKIVTTTSANSSFPFASVPLAIWNETVGSAVTVTVCGTWATGTVVPFNDECWMDVDYLATSGSTLATITTTGLTLPLVTHTACTSDASTWTGTPAGGGTVTKFKFTVTITPQLKGWITGYVRCAKPSATFYIDPMITLT